ncbi:MAG: tetratricopeptide repeat protein [Verrucomicrobiota bacterium]
MTTNPSVENQPKDQAAAPHQPGFEEAVQAFWEKNRGLILAACVIALLVVIGREGWGHYQASREREIRGAYARAADRPEQLATFAKAHEGHALAAIALLRIADQRYAAGDYRQARENYTKAAAGLKHGALLGRARIGAAMSQLNSGDKTAAEAALKEIAADAALAKGVRAEATYHLAALALEAGNTAEVSRLATEIGKIDPTSVWSQRATSLVVAKPQL